MKKRYLFWILSVFGFPIGGFAAINLFSTNEGPLPAAAAGYVAGFVIGIGQWLSARATLSLKWPFLTGVGLALGALIGEFVVQGKTDPTSLTIFGLVSGAIVAMSQAFEFSAKNAIIWLASATTLWTIAWAITANVIVDPERGYVVFGMSGAVVYTLALGFLVARTPVKVSK